MRYIGTGKGQNMLKVVVFDLGWGGELVANYLDEEIGVLEIVRVIDWHDAHKSDYDASELCKIAERQLQRYLGKVDLIVLGGYTVSIALDYLRKHYPEQKFVGMGINYYRVLKTRCSPDNVAILANKTLINHATCQEIRDSLPLAKIIIPDCSGWEELIDVGDMSLDVLWSELGEHFRLCKLPRRSVPPNNAELLRPDTLLILNTHFWEIKADLERMFGYQVRILDFRQKLLHDVCAALSLRGVDGCRSK